MCVPGCFRADVPVRRDPLKVEVKFGPQNVCDPCTVILLGFDPSFRILEQDIDPDGNDH